MTNIHKFSNVVNYVFQKSLSRNELKQTQMYKQKMIYLENPCIKRLTHVFQYAIIIFHTKI